MISVYKLFEKLDYPQKWGTKIKKDDIKNRFVIHEHHADRAGLHWDLRIEYDGILKSWATKKLPQIISGEVNKIQLFPTPDHDLSWYNFSGTIEDGYGKGDVSIWDTGSVIKYKWSDDKKILQFNGYKLKGKYAIINNLLIKMKS